MVQESPGDYWRRFDLADALLFSGNYSEGRIAYDEALALVPDEQARDVLSSVLGPLRNDMMAGAVDGQLHEEVRILIEKIEAKWRPQPQ